MALNFTISKGAIPAPQVVSPATVANRAGTSRALAFTHPILTIDQTGISYKQRVQAGVREFSFDFGTIRITLRQDVLIASDLTPCEQRKWAAHERGHVNDNRGIMDNLEAEVMNYGLMQDVFVNGQWYPRTDFNLIQQLIENDVGTAFRTLEAAAVAAHDTTAEYRRVAREILRDCPGPIRYVVQSGDTLSQIALHYYGNASKWRKIYDANVGVIGANPHFIRAGDTIVIPR
ncbi:MAG: LysM peptidoglycan-binding domain-containing protein [Fuerstiella sp.]